MLSNFWPQITQVKASYVTGTTFSVDGGMTLYPSFGTSEEHNMEKHSSSSASKRSVAN